MENKTESNAQESETNQKGIIPNIFDKIEALEKFLEELESLEKSFKEIFGRIVSANVGIRVYGDSTNSLNIDRFNDLIAAIKTQTKDYLQDPAVFKELHRVYKQLKDKENL